jgi:hypothetical protein
MPRHSGKAPAFFKKFSLPRVPNARALGEDPFFFFFLLLYRVTNKAYIYTNHKSTSISH